MIEIIFYNLIFRITTENFKCDTKIIRLGEKLFRYNTAYIRGRKFKYFEIFHGFFIQMRTTGILNRISIEYNSRSNYNAEDNYAETADISMRHVQLIFYGYFGFIFFCAMILVAEKYFYLK